MARPKVLDLEQQFSFYAAYHTNTKNVLIHVLCVPTILFSGLILTHGIPGAATSLAHLDVDLFGKHFGVDVTIPFLWAAGNAAYFVLLEPVAGLLYAPILLAFGHYSNVWYSLHHDQAMKYATVAHVGSWIAQFIGHGAFEGRAPALLDSLLQSLVLAVFFVFVEVLFVLGYRPALHKRIKARTGVAVAQFRKERAAKERLAKRS
ncbi:hypothetical protein JCM3770_001665 [Rhodotorula araucariae]